MLSKKIKRQHMLHHQELNTTKKSKQMCFFVLYSFMLKRGMNADENELNESKISCWLTCEGNGGHT